MPKKSLVVFLSLALLIGCASGQKNAKTAVAPLDITASLNYSTASDLDAALKSGLPTVLELGSDSCYFCRQMKLVLAKLAAEQHGKINVLIIDVYENKDLAGDFGVTVLPSFVFFDRKGKPRAQTEGAMTKEDLIEMIESLSLR